MTLGADEFIGRFLIHVLPDGFHQSAAGSYRASGLIRWRSLLIFVGENVEVLNLVAMSLARRILAEMASRAT